MISMDVIELARKHLDAGTEIQMRDSAELCLEDADNAEEEGDYKTAKRRALKSLAYSVGMSHPDYLLAAKEYRSIEK